MPKLNQKFYLQDLKVHGKKYMKKYQVCVYAISKNEEKFVHRWMDSMSEADIVIVTDTGSTDDTVQKLRDRGALVFEEKINPWRFDKARNLSLSHVPEGTEIAVCTDLDEVFRPGWRNLLEAAWKPDATMGHYLYNWSLTEDGTPLTQFTYFKVHARNSYTWACPVHEYLKFDPTVSPLPEKRVFIPDMTLDHYPDRSKSRSSYLDLLELGVREDPQDDRMTYYLGREYMYSSRWQDCITTLQAYLQLPRAVWLEERSAAMRWIAKCFNHLGNTQAAYQWYYRAIAETPHMRESYIECAQAAYQISDWPTILFMTSEALKIKEKSKTYINMGYAWNHALDDLAAIALYRLGNYEESLVHARQALTLAPEDDRLIKNYYIIKEKCDSIRVNQSSI